jgi:hypothetical protein
MEIQEASMIYLAFLDELFLDRKNRKESGYTVGKRPHQAILNSPNPTVYDERKGGRCSNRREHPLDLIEFFGGLPEVLLSDEYYKGTKDESRRIYNEN